MDFRENLKEELNYQDLLVKELAEKTGISKRTLDNYLRAKSSDPPVSNAVKIAKALNVSVEFLVTGKPLEQNSPNKDFSLEKKYLDKISTFDESDRKLLRVMIDTLAEKY